MKLPAAFMVLAAVAASTSAMAQPQGKTWLVCRASLDVTRYVTPPVLVASSEIPRLSKEFEKLANSIGNQQVCTAYSSASLVPVEERAGSSYPAAWGGGTISVVAFPNLPPNWGRSASTTNEASSPSTAAPTKSANKEVSSQKPATVTPKYVEVPGPNGIVRLSPEVAARNKAAAEEYQRKLKAHADAIAQTRARNERSAAQHAPHWRVMPKPLLKPRPRSASMNDNLQIMRPRLPLTKCRPRKRPVTDAHSKQPVLFVPPGTKRWRL